MDVERRRSLRVPLWQEEAAVVQAGGREILVRVVDFSPIGALLSLLEIPGLSESSADFGERVNLSMHLDESVFQVAARVVRRTPGFVAVEFVDTGETSDKIEAKVRSIAMSGTFSEGS